MPNRFFDATSTNPTNPRALIRWPSIAVVNRAKQPLGVELEELAAALQDFVAVHFGPIWNCFCSVAVKSEPESDDWPMLFVDDDQIADAVAFHDLAKGLYPEMVVDVTKALEGDGCVSIAAGHELAETLADPWCFLSADLGDGRFVAYETVDPVQDTSFELRGLKMPNFVTPEWFNGKWPKGSQPFDYVGAIDTPLTLTKGGYAMVYSTTIGQWEPVMADIDTFEKVEEKVDGKHRPYKRGVQNFGIGHLRLSGRI